MSFLGRAIRNPLTQGSLIFPSEAPVASSATAPAGWYPDPSGSPQQRWWDGVQWSATPTPPAHLTPPPRSAASPFTPYIWVLALWPLLGWVTPRLTNVLVGDSGNVVVGFWYLSQAVDFAINSVFYLGAVVIALADYRALLRRGIMRPFHWAWAFVQPVYIIGRAVVAYQRCGRGLSPMVVYFVLALGVWVFYTFVVAVLVVMLSGVFS